MHRRVDYMVTSLLFCLIKNTNLTLILEFVVMITLLRNITFPVLSTILL